MRGTFPFNTVAADKSLKPNNPAVRNIQPQNPAGTIRVRLNSIPFPHTGIPVSFTLDRFATLNEFANFIFWLSSGANLHSIHLVCALNIQTKVVGVAYYKSAADANLARAFIRINHTFHLRRGADRITWNQFECTVFPYTDVFPISIGVLNSYLSRYYTFVPKPRQVSPIASAVKRRLFGTGQDWERNTKALSGLGFIHLPRDELNGLPVAKLAHPYPLNPRLPILPLPQPNQPFPHQPEPVEIIDIEPPPIVPVFLAAPPPAIEQQHLPVDPLPINAHEALANTEEEEQGEVELLIVVAENDNTLEGEGDGGDQAVYIDSENLAEEDEEAILDAAPGRLTIAQQ